MPTEILLVEDSPTQALRLKLLLEKKGLRVVWTKSGQAGIQIARTRALAAVILDINLADVNGFQVCQVLKESAITAHVPVIMLTCMDAYSDALTGLDIGADDYIPKDDFAEYNLLEALRELAILGPTVATKAPVWS